MKKSTASGNCDASSCCNVARDEGRPSGQSGSLKVAADTHKLVFENTFVRVLEVHVPPGKTEPMHSHGRRVVVYLSDFHTRTTERGGRPQDNLRRKGLVRWSDPLVHTVENIGKIEGHVISVELK